MKKNLVFLTGAGMSAESGINTFRDENGLWEGHDVQEVASPVGFTKNPALVLDFYNKRRSQLNTVEPNEGHKLIASLEKDFNVSVLTQNVDDLHERAGSTDVIHLHGELRKVRSIGNREYVKNWDEDLEIGDTCPDGYQLRPHIVWFGEEVPMMDEAMEIVPKADILVIIGTSLEVYPAASLVHFAPQDTPIYIIDPNRHEDKSSKRITVISKGATEGMKEFISLEGK